MFSDLAMTAWSKEKSVLLLTCCVLVVVLWWKRQGGRGAPRKRTTGERKKEIRVNGEFFRRVVVLSKMCVPHVVGVESALLVLLALLLVVRTRLTLIMSGVVGRNAQSLVERNLKQFILNVADIGFWAFPSSVVNSGIRYTTAVLEQRFRTNLQHAIHDKYLSGFVAYHVACEKGTLDNPDHRMTDDILHFSSQITDLFPSVFKPLIDIVTFVWKLSQHGGMMPPILLIMYYIVAGFIVRSLQPNFAKLTAESEKLEGNFHSAHSQIIQHAEEIAFYRGERTEERNAQKSLECLVQHHLYVRKLKSVSDFLDAIFIKYGATCVGNAVCSIGVFQLRGKAPPSELTRVYVQSSQIYIPLARAIGKIVMLYKRITTLAGSTSRVAELNESFDVFNSRTVTAASNLVVKPRSNVISLESVVITTPANQTLVRNLSIEFVQGEHVLIMGGNGSGKSSLMRVIAGLWPTAAGTVSRPPLGELMFLPQRVYLLSGTLRQQLIFPDTEQDCLRKGVSDEDLLEMVAEVGLRSVVTQHGGLGSEKEWHDVLSGGERQRVALVRVMYHRPSFALLDECTSAVSQEIENNLYLHLKRRGATLITVSHRESLMQHHDKLLSLDGLGGYQVTKK